MSTFLFAWELGGGLGHLARLGPLASGLASRGHRVVAALRRGERGERFFPGVERREAPHAAEVEGESAVGSYADVLREAGWGDRDGFEGRLARWRALLDEIGPDVLVMDHAPTALLAAQGRPTRRVLVGTGFEAPPDVEPLPDLRPPGAPPAPEEARAWEPTFRATANAWLAAIGEPPLLRLASLFTRVDASWLATFPELDHHPGREGGDYQGVWAGRWGEPPRWPKAGRPRVFAYLKPFRALGAMLEILGRTKLPALVAIDAPAGWALPSPGLANLGVVRAPIDLSRAAREADLVVLHAGHGSTAAMLLAGRPILAIPLHLEQLQVSRRIVAARAGQIASPTSPEQMAEGLRRLLVDDRFARGAQAFARTHAGFDPERAVAGLVDRLEAMASPG